MRDKIQINGNLGVGEYNLLIHIITERDLGYYRYETANGTDTLRQDFQLRIGGT